MKYFRFNQQRLSNVAAILKREIIKFVLVKRNYYKKNTQDAKYVIQNKTNMYCLYRFSYMDNNQKYN